MKKSLNFKKNQTVSVIVRIIDSRIHTIERALFSIYCNQYPHKEVILVYQGTNPDVQGYLRKLIPYYPALNIQMIINPTQQDERSKNLNLGIQKASGRYVCILDDDDLYYGDHLSTLVQLLQDSQKAWAYCQTARYFEKNGYLCQVDYPYWKPAFSYRALLEDNYIPIHSFILDRSRIKPKDLIFDESYTKVEDYAFLLKLAHRYEPAVSPKTTCAFIFRSDGSNSTLDATACQLFALEPDLRKERDWQKNRLKIQALKKSLLSDRYWLQELENST